MTNSRIDLTRFAQLLFSGRGFLLAGQALEPKVPATIVRMMEERHSREADVNSLSKLCDKLSRAEPIDELFMDPEFDEALGVLPTNIARVPWSGAISSAVDQRLVRALSETRSDSRRLRYIFPTDGNVGSFSRNPSVLSILRLSHVRDDASTSGSLAVGPDWRRIDRRFAPAILDRLPDMVGLGHVLCIAGIANDDLINLDTLIEVIKDFNGSNVYWFIAETDGIDIDLVREELPGIWIIESDLEANLADYLADKQRASDAEVRTKHILDIGDLLVTVKKAGKQQVIKFTSEELREFRPHLNILGDFPGAPEALHDAERRSEFVKFLSRPINLSDWEGIAQGFIFQREGYQRLYKAVHRHLNAIENRRAMPGGNRPIFLAGPPATGRSFGLRWLGLILRIEQVFVVDLTTTGADLNITAIEKIIRLAEGRGVLASIVLLDRPERAVAWELGRRLYNAGRRSVVVATAAKLPPSISNPSSLYDLEEEELSNTDIELDYQLSVHEKESFVEFLERNGVTNSEEIIRYSGNEEFFATLYRLIPETRSNIIQAIVEEFEMLRSFLRSLPNRQKSAVAFGGTMADQMHNWLEANPEFSRTDGDNRESKMPVGWVDLVNQLPLLVMLFSKLGLPASTEGLLRMFPLLIRYYNPFVMALESRGLAFETPIGREGRSGIEAVNQLVARIIIDRMVPDTAEQIKLLGDVVLSFRWDVDARRTEYPEQFELIQALRSVSPPRGAFTNEYNRIRDLEALATIYKDIRETLNVESSALMLSEGTLLRAVGKVQSDIKKALENFRESEKILQRVYDIVLERPASPARSAELGNILSAGATTAGHIASALAKISRDPMDADVRKMTDQALQDATRSRAYQDNYYPLDIAYWTNRDQFTRLRDRHDNEAIEGERIKLLDNMASALDSAVEIENLPPDQLDNYRKRCVELSILQGEVNLARDMAEEDARRKVFGGVCIIAREIAFDMKTGAAHSREAFRKALDYLHQFTPEIFGHMAATTLMHRLWVGSQLGDKTLDQGPHTIGCGVTQWAELETILRAREQLNPQSPVPYVSFWQSVSLAHQGDFSGALRVLRRNDANIMNFGYRRLNPLILITEENGSTRVFTGIVRRFETSEAIMVYLPSPGWEVLIQRRYKGLASLLNVQKGDEIQLNVGLSYWRPMGVATDWSTGRSSPMEKDRA